MLIFINHFSNHEGTYNCQWDKNHVFSIDLATWDLNFRVSLVTWCWEEWPSGLKRALQLE